MRGIEGEIVTDRSVEEMFDFVADERNEPRCNPRMRRAEQLLDGPIGVGTRFRAETVSMGQGAIRATIAWFREHLKDLHQRIEQASEGRVALRFRGRDQT